MRGGGFDLTARTHSHRTHLGKGSRLRGLSDFVVDAIAMCVGILAGSRLIQMKILVPLARRKQQ
jgi:hypothetical protein